MANYYDKIDEILKKQIEEALVSIDAQEKAALARLGQRREQAYSTYLSGAAGAYSDYAHAVNPYGVNNENLYSSGLGNSGKSETARASYYNAYTELLGNLRNTYSDELTELNLEEKDQNARFSDLRTQANTQAYNKLLDELIRRQEAQVESERFEYEKSVDERDYNFKVAQAQYEKEKDERDYQYKLSKDEYERYLDSLKNSGSSYSGSIKASDSKEEALEAIDFEGTDMLSDSQFEWLKQMFIGLTNSVLPGEDNPTPRIRRYKTRYIDMFKNRLKPHQLLELMRL